MSEQQPVMPPTTQTAMPYWSYIAGFILSVLLTLEAYAMVMTHTGNWWLIYALLGFAFAQLIVQLVFFLHVGQETKSYWNLMFLLSAAGIILIVVTGSIWIMNHLNYRMSPGDMSKYLMQEENIQR